MDKSSFSAYFQQPLGCSEVPHHTKNQLLFVRCDIVEIFDWEVDKSNEFNIGTAKNHQIMFGKHSGHHCATCVKLTMLKSGPSLPVFTWTVLHYIV